MEGLCLRIDCALKAADLNLVGVAGIDHDHARLLNKRIPFRRRDFRSHLLGRIGMGLTESDDLGFDFHHEPLKRMLRGL